MLNRVMLIGHLGADPTVKHTSSGSAVADLRLATTRKLKDRDGAAKEDTQWHRVVAWGKLAEICGEHLRKGRQIYVEGRLQTRKWRAKDGSYRYSTEVVGDEIKFLGGGKRDQDDQAPAGDDAAPPSPSDDSDLPF
jgi:single-strand DNA-binding protein